MRALLQDQRGFTLLELLFVAILLGAISTIIFGTMSSIITNRSVMQSRQISINAARIVLTRMSKEIASRVAEPLANESGANSGRTGMAQLSRQYIRGSNKEKDSAALDSLRFVSIGTAQAAMAAFGNSGIVEIEYRLEEPEANDQQQEYEDGLKSYLLLREEIPAGVDNREIQKAGRVIFPLADNVVGLNFRYLQNGAWTNEWKGVRSRLPEALEITLKLRQKTGGIETYRTAVAVTKKRRSFLGRGTT